MIRLPVTPNEKPMLTCLSDYNDDIETVILLPGDVLLSESVIMPAPVNSKRQLRQWLYTNPEVCQWDPDTEELIWVDHEDTTCYYWAVEKDTWKLWKELISEIKEPTIVFPDWMLLPPPVQGKQFALKLNDQVLCRYEKYAGSVVPLERVDLVNQLTPRWLSITGENTDSWVLSKYIQGQKKKYKEFLHLRRRKYQLKIGEMQSYILCGFLAIALSQSITFIWLNMTHHPLAQDSNIPIHKSEPRHDLSNALNILSSMQQQGPLTLEKFVLRSGTITITANSSVPCNVLKERLSALLTDVNLESLTGNCHLQITRSVR